MVSINVLPDEIVELIFFNLPPYEDLNSCALVCKRWASVVHNVKRLTNNNLHKGLIDYRLNWKTLTQLDTSPTIAARFSHAAIVHNHSMYVYGGGSSTETTFNDLWKFDLSNRKWIRPMAKGTYPSPKASASIVCYKDSLVLFGGWRHPPAMPPHQPWRLFDDLHIYNIANNQWTLAMTDGTPPPMTGHSATVHGNRMIVFGGYQESAAMSGSCNNVWCLNLDTFVWRHMETTNTKPPPRYGQLQVYLDDDNLLILGGCGGPNSIYSDAWILNMTGEIWSWLSVRVDNKKWAASHIWCNTACKVGTKLVVLGPIASVAADFQFIKHRRSRRNSGVPLAEPAQQVRNVNENQRPRHQHNGHHQGGNEQPVLRDPRQIVEEANRRLHEERNRRNNRENNGSVGIARSSVGNPGPSSGTLTRRPYPRSGVEDEEEAISRLKRNLQLKSRDAIEEQFLPKRFDEPLPERLGMAAFSVQLNPVPEPGPHNERRLEGLRKMEEKIREMQRVADVEDLPSPKRVKRNCTGLYVCDLSTVLSSPDNIPTLNWMEYKNDGVIHGAPEHLIMTSMVAGNGELIMFGGLRKESLTDTTPTWVSNALHILTFPRGVI